MKLLYLALLLPLSVSAEQLQPLAKPELATVLGLLEELTPATQHSEQPFIVRIYAAPEQISECDGSVASCPDVRLFFTVSSGDILEVPTLYQLPAQKGWQFKAWTSTTGNKTAVSFTVQTRLPETNIEVEARQAWRAQEFIITASPESASYVSR